ncbi:unnamed protein product [Bursaphelenchus xylophilus]|uniref:(pine wood nematode) hypothetical protein n=1 Tax=Bursaphelenchus xylophilus TaxID=6326 RepID=A0A1I7S738_BURXY|nr:unnamed protein product [Bursaphelenchus xylophilus]CAG9084572.1 unnamed protein product [Bursaphelenchus xylophilus]
MGRDFENFQNLCESVLQDLKSTNCTWEVMSSRAAKLACQLNNTVVCLSNFVDCLQILSDSSNSINGASRDIGAALTRFCLRQRTLQSDMKRLSNIISNFCPTLDRKAAEWKQLVADLQRRNHRIVKKKRNKKDHTSSITEEQKQYCTELLFSQRQLFLEFLNLIVPIMKGEIAVLDEGVHIKEIQESVEMDIMNTDSALIVKAAIEDGLADDKTYRGRMTSPSRSTSSSKASFRLTKPHPNSSPSSSGSTFNWGDVDQRGLYSSKGSLGNKTTDGAQNPLFGKPPFPLKSGHDDGGPELLVPGLGVSSALSVSASDISIGEDYAFHPPASNWSSLHNYEESLNKFNADLSSLCSLSGNRTMRSKSSLNSNTSFRQRPPSIRNPPPPPERRNSAITAATPDAPSIVDLRNGISSAAPPRTNSELCGSQNIANTPWSQLQSENDIYSNT